MPALFGYLIAISMLLGGAYAGLEWLSAPDQRPAEKSAAHKVAQTGTGAAPVPNTADSKRNAGTTAKPASKERSDEAGPETKSAESNATGKASKGDKSDSVPVTRCAPIGLTANGDFVFSMQCQEMIERHRGELASSEATPTAPPSTDDQAARAAKPNDNGKPTPDAPNAARNDATANPEIRPSDRNESNPNFTNSNSGTRISKREIARREPNASRAEPLGSRRAEPPKNNPAAAAQDTVTTGEARSGNANPDLELAPAKAAKKKQLPRPRPPEAIVRAAEHHDASREQRDAGREQRDVSREQRSPPPQRSRTMAARGDSDLWYNVLGLR
jgi:hypothetical protein